MNRLSATIILYGIGAFFLLLFLFAFVPYLFEVSENIKYYKIEMKRSSNEKVLKFWESKLRRYILSQIPIVNLFVKK